MSLRNVLHILWRHKWLMLGIVFVTMLAVPLRLMGSQNEYTGTVKLLVTAPEQTSVALFGDYRTSTAADEINIARNNFGDVLKSEETRRRVITSLNLPEALQDYKVSVSLSRETDFLTVQITTLDSQWAAQIANEHIAQARQYFGEIRAQPAALAKLALAAQVSEATAQLAQAEQALVDFKNEHQISSIEAEQSLRMAVLSRLYDDRYTAELASQGAILAQAFPELIRSLESQRSAAMQRQESARADAWDEVIAFTSGQIMRYSQGDETLTPVDRLNGVITEIEAQRAAAAAAGRLAAADGYAYVIAYYSGQLLSLKQATTTLEVTNQLIANQEAAVADLNALMPQYSELATRAEQAQANLRTLSDAYQEAVIKEDTALRADFLQVVLPAAVEPGQDTSAAISLIALGLIASLGAAVTLAFVAELLGRWLWPAEPAPANPKAATIGRRNG
jgi:uncharacterized protein involved in exopolysaccharide biosynthesis